MAIAVTQPVQKTNQVKEFFDRPQTYLTPRQFDIAVRSETVREFAGDIVHPRVLDIGCGDGALSLPLLNEQSHITLLDLSANMLSRASSRVPAGLKANVRIIQGDFMTADVGHEAYDLVICVGVLAHVDSLFDFMAKVASVVKPGGRIILQITDSAHFLSRALGIYEVLLNLVKPRTYSLNRLTRPQVLGIARANHLRLIAAFRYGLPLPGLTRVFSQETLHKMVRVLFGTAAANRNACFGTESVLLFRRH